MVCRMWQAQQGPISEERYEGKVNLGSEAKLRKTPHEAIQKLSNNVRNDVCIALAS
jgi:hypothetical protein